MGQVRLVSSIRSRPSPLVIFLHGLESAWATCFTRGKGRTFLCVSFRLSRPSPSKYSRINEPPYSALRTCHPRLFPFPFLSFPPRHYSLFRLSLRGGFGQLKISTKISMLLKYLSCGFSFLVSCWSTRSSSFKADFSIWPRFSNIFSFFRKNIFFYFEEYTFFSFPHIFPRVASPHGAGTAPEASGTWNLNFLVSCWSTGSTSLQQIFDLSSSFEYFFIFSKEKSFFISFFLAFLIFFQELLTKQKNRGHVEAFEKFRSSFHFSQHIFLAIEDFS